MSQPRYLTKSRFKLALECPTKLFYTNKKEYANQKLEDQFLRHLADGGFQVGKLAQCYFPGGIEIETRDYEQSLAETVELLGRDNVIIFEGAFRHENLFIRADIVVKGGTAIDLIEVKAKSCDFETEDACWDRRRGPTNGQIKSDWHPYLADVAFQKYVIEQAYPQYTVSAHLMLADKTSACPTEGLNQKFRFVTVDGDRKVEISPELSETDLEPWILRKIAVEESCSKVYAAARLPYAETRAVASVPETNETGRFGEYVEYLSDKYARDEMIPPVPSKECKSCEFRCDDGSLKSGFHECWAAAFGWQPNDFEGHTVLDLWSFRGRDDLIGIKKLKLSEITPDDIAPKSKPKELESGMNLFARQCKQLEVAASGNLEPWLDREGLKAQMKKWKFPLHFIDFETCRPAIPFRAGRRPYEGIAFQFSHHIVHRDGRVEHAGEFLEATPGRFPSYDLVRELKRQLEHDEGTIFRYHNHENSVLCETRNQLLADPGDVADRDELVRFIESITQPRSRKDHPGDTWEAGLRNMVDLCKMVERYYYHHATRGSISLKYILPATIASSEFLQTKYSQPIYGADGGIPSLNFKDKRWIVSEERSGTAAPAGRHESDPESAAPAGRHKSEPGAVATGAFSADAIENPKSKIQNRSVRDPYSLLGPILPDESAHANEVLTSAWYDEEVRDGGAAMTAYCKLQFTDVPDDTRRAIEASLKRYCELDTLAMVMIYEAWRAELQ